MCMAVWHINRYITLINIEGLWILKPTDSNDMIEFFPPTQLNGKNTLDKVFDYNSVLGPIRNEMGYFQIDLQQNI